MREEHIKNLFDVAVDGLNGINYYRISEAYNTIEDDGFAVYHQRILDEFSMTWDEIDAYGGIAQINKEIREGYNID